MERRAPHDLRGCAVVTIRAGCRVQAWRWLGATRQLFGIRSAPDFLVEKPLKLEVASYGKWYGRVAGEPAGLEIRPDGRWRMSSPAAGSSKPCCSLGG